MMTYICVRPQVKVSVGRMRIVTFTERSEWKYLILAFTLMPYHICPPQQETRKDEPRLKRKTESDIDMYSKNIKVNRKYIEANTTRLNCSKSIFSSG